MASPAISASSSKLSGEALAGDDAYGINPQTIADIVGEIKAVADLGVEIGVVIGGGNIFRGMAGTATGMDRATADYMGMLATVMNAMALVRCLPPGGTQFPVSRRSISSRWSNPISGARPSAISKKARSSSSVPDGQSLLYHRYRRRLRGIGNRSAEIVLKATKVDGIYSADPKRILRHPLTTGSASTKRFPNLAVMDATAFALCRDQKLPINVFSIFKAGALKRVVCGEDEGTLVYC